MADELTLSASLAYSKSGETLRTAITGLQRDVTGTEHAKYVQLIGTSEEALILTDIGTPGYCLLRNLDETNYVSIRSGTAAANCIELLPGDFALFRFARTATAPFALANTSACRVEITIIES